MRLRNKKTGEIASFEGFDARGKLVVPKRDNCYHNSFDELRKEREGYGYWYITDIGCIGREIESKQNELRKRCGNHFETKEEAEKTVEKLKAWKRLRDKGFKFYRYEVVDGTIRWNMDLNGSVPKEVYKDLDLLFGGEE